MKEDNQRKRASKARFWHLIKYAFLSIIFIFGLVSIIATGGGGGGGGGGGDGDNGYIPTPGPWSGDDISFTVSKDSTLVSDFSFTYSGHASGSICSFDYTSTVTYIQPGFPIENNSFSYEDPCSYPPFFDFKCHTINGDFIDEENAEIEISWSGYDSFCDADYSGTRTYSASYQP